MALTSSQITSRLFKKSLGAGETLVNRQFFEEPKLGRDFVVSSQLWTESGLIPSTAPVLVSGASSGVVQYFEKQTLTHVSGSTNLAYYSANLVDSIPFNYDMNGGSYNYALYKNDGTTVIAFGEGDWLVDNSAGLLTFYGTLPSGVSSASPPKISFYKYIGSKGFPSSSGGTITGVVAGLGLTGGGTSSSITLDLSLSNNSGLTFSNNNLSIDYSSTSTNLAGSGLSANGGTLSVNVGNGLEIVSDTVYLGGTLSQNTVIDANSNNFYVGNANFMIFTASNLWAADVIDSSGSYVEYYADSSLVFDIKSNRIFNGLGSTVSQIAGDAYNGVSIQIGETQFPDQNDPYNYTDILSSIAMSYVAGTVSDGSSDNRMVIRDDYSQKGLVYMYDYSSNFTTQSLVTKGYVDSAISGFGAGTLAGVTAGNGLSGGGTANYITLDVNLGVNSGLTFSGDDIIIDNTIIPGNGLTANGYSLDVNVNSDSLEISNDLLRLKDTITGNRTFQDTLTINGDLVVNGTVSYIQTETLLIEDNIITLNATFSGTPFLNAGIEVVRGNETAAALIWNESTDTWNAGLSGSEVSILLNAGNGLVKLGPTVSLDFTSIAGFGLTQNGSQLSVDLASINSVPVYQSGVSSVTSGDGSTTGLTITATPSQYSRVQVFVNGQLQKLGDGVNTNVDCYFSNDGGVSSVSLNNISFGDTLYWNGIFAKFGLDSSDEVEIIYES